MISRTSLRSSMRAAKCEPLGSEIVSFEPSSETAVELRSSDPFEGASETSPLTASRHRR